MKQYLISFHEHLLQNMVILNFNFSHTIYPQILRIIYSREDDAAVLFVTRLTPKMSCFNAFRILKIEVWTSSL